MRFTRFAVMPLFALLSFALSARADILTLTITGSTQLSGTLVADTNTVTYIGGSISFFDGTTTYTFDPVTDFDSSYIIQPPDGNFSYAIFFNSAGDQLDLASLLGNSLVDTLPICSLANPCEFLGGPAYSYFTPYFADPVKIADGYLAPSDVVVADTPEPSSFALLGTGLLSAAGMARRRFRRA